MLRTGKDGKVAKCFKCRCEHEENCECPCTYHLANQCNNKKEKADDRADLGLFIKTNGPTLFMSQEGGSDEDIVLFSMTFDRDEEIPAEVVRISNCEEAPASNPEEEIPVSDSDEEIPASDPEEEIPASDP